MLSYFNLFFILGDIMTFLFFSLIQFMIQPSLFASFTLPKLLLSPISKDDSYISSLPKTCFTPGQHCIDFILQIIKQAQTSVFVQAYEFTSLALAQGLCQAKERGVDVILLMDRSQLTQKKSQLSLFQKAGISVYIDLVPGIAHNKIMIIDSQSVLTGSFNWTEAAQKRNAENLLWITDPSYVQPYLDNWHMRYEKSLHNNLPKS